MRDYSFLMEESCFFNSRLLGANRTLYNLCMLYYDKYNTEMNYRKKWTELSEKYMSRHQKTATHFAGYIAFYLYEYFFRCFEDYSFLKNIRTGLVHLNMVFMLSVLRELETDSFGTEEIETVFSVYNRRAYFNPGIPEDMYGVWEK